MVTIEELLAEAGRAGASDIHLSAGEPPMLRIHGNLRRTARPALSAAEAVELIDAIMGSEQRQQFAAHHEVDFAWELPDQGRFRVNVFLHSRGHGAVLRAIPAEVPSLEALGLPPFLRDVCYRERGLVLATGPTGSGKSTTLAALVDVINESHEGHILTVEDPIEFVHRPKRCLINQREVSSHTESFSAALRSALREDPDVILVGEMRDLETISLALTAAETGHLVFGTLHTSSAANAIDRIIDVFPAGQQGQIRTMLSESLQAVVAQTLFEKKGGGRVAACEILVGVQAVRNLIREGKLHQIQSMMQTGQRVGMQTLDVAVADLVRRGVIEPRSAPDRQGARRAGCHARDDQPLPKPINASLTP